MPSSRTDRAERDRQERAIVADIARSLVEAGAFVRKIHGDPMQPTTIDLHICYRGLFVGLEVKRVGEDATERQEYEIEQIRNAGGIAATVHSVAETWEVLRSVHGSATAISR